MSPFSYAKQPGLQSSPSTILQENFRLTESFEPELVSQPRPRTSNAPCPYEGLFVAELIAFASTSLGAAKVRAAAISIPGFADQEQENKTRGLQEPQLLF